MVRLARRWCRILGLDPDAAPPAPIVIDISDLLDAIREAIGAIDAAVEADFTPPPPFPPGRQAEREAENTARIDADRAAREVFARRTTPRAVTGTREPRDGEKAAARRLTRTLRDATAGGRDTVTVTSPVPPGRLRMRQVLAADAQRAAGARPTAEPFTRTRSRRVPPRPCAPASPATSPAPCAPSPARSPRPPGSWPAPPAPCPPRPPPPSCTASRSTPSPTPATPPPRSPTSTPPTAPSSCAAPSTPSTARSASPVPGTARLLAIVSDTYHSEDEIAGAQRRITRLAKTGCGVIILQPDDPFPWGEKHDWADAQVITLTDPADTIEIIARAATRAMTA